MLSLNALSTDRPQDKLARHLRVIETKGGLCLIDGDLTRNLGDVAVERTANVIVIAEDECLAHVETNRHDVLCVLEREVICLFYFQLVFEQELLVIYDAFSWLLL